MGFVTQLLLCKLGRIKHSPLMTVTYYNEGTDAKGHYLESTVENEYGDVVSQKKVYYPLVKFKSHQKLYFLQYNDKMELIYEVCNYLNYYINESSEQTRDFKAKTLRNYLCFMALSGFDYTDLTDQYVLERIYSFFRGDDFRSTHNDYRSRQTVNNYISVIRDFARYLNKPSSILQRTSYIQSGYREDGMTSLPKIYPSSMRNNPHANDLIKPYISPQEYTVLKKLAIAKNDTQAVLLFHLMYFYGLRIGECLGLTEEDFIIRQQHYNPSPTILLRNRLSDRPFQFVKEVGHPKSIEDYKKRHYPHQKITTSIAFYERITSFIEQTYKELETRGIHDRSVADAISKNYIEEKGNNHYVFVNKHGQPLTQQAWNLRLKEYFTAAQIPIDINVRKDNLNHRFRHGCAMYYLRFAEEGYKLSVEGVAALLRHRNLSTIYNYLKMTLDDEFMLKQQFQDSLLRDIPNL